MNFQELPRINSTQTQVALQIAWISRIVLNLIGASGIGKSQVVKGYAYANGSHFIDFRLSDRDGVLDVRGITFKHVLPDGTVITSSAPPKDLLAALEQGAHITLFLDEYGLADDEARKASMRISTDLQVGEHQLSENTQIVMAMNSAKDRPIGARMSGPESMRVCNLVMHPSVRDVTRGFITGFQDTFEDMPDISSMERIELPHLGDKRIAGFMEWRPDYVHDFDPELFQAGKLGFCSPRTWEYASRVVKVCDMEPFKSYKGIRTIRKAMVSGLVGTTAATECLATMDYIDRVIKVKDVIADPMTAQLPDPNDEKCVGVCWMGIGTLTDKKHFNKDTADNIIKYIKRLQTFVNPDLGKAAVTMLRKSKDAEVLEAVANSAEYTAYEQELAA